ncbi:unnamed protein product [Boreogadus saida]
MKGFLGDSVPGCWPLGGDGSPEGQSQAPAPSRTLTSCGSSAAEMAAAPPSGCDRYITCDAEPLQWTVLPSSDKITPRHLHFSSTHLLFLLSPLLHPSPFLLR